MDLNASVKRVHQDHWQPESQDSVLLRPKRPKSSKACNACRKQKSRCEKLAGESDSCHRCNVIGITCVFDADPSSERVRNRKPRPLLPRAREADVAQPKRPTECLMPQISTSSLDTARLHALADTTEMLSRPTSDQTSPLAGCRPRDSFPPANSSAASTTPASGTTLSPETLSTVESTLFPSPRDPTSEGQSARIRADWKRWVAPLTLLQSLVRRNRPSVRSMSPTSQRVAHVADYSMITPAQERRLKEHFRLRYLPWLPAVRFARQDAPNCLDNVSPFLATVICATAVRTLGDISAKSIEHLRSRALHHLGTVFSNPGAHRLVDSLYALLILIMWPLDPADDVVLLVNGAKQLANSYERSRGSFLGGRSTDASEGLDADHMRLWYTICASETIFSLGAGSHASPPALEDLVACVGSASDVALESGHTSDILIVLQTSLHRIIAAAMFENEQQASLKSDPPPLKGRERLLHYIRTVHMILTRLGEWDIEFHSISEECDGLDAVHYTALEIEYHYLCLMLVTHCLLTLCHACPLVSAPEEVKFALWSWSITGSKSAHAAVRLFNAFSQHESAAPLATAPDRIFAMMVISVMLILRHQVAAQENGRRRGASPEPPTAGFTKQAENAIRTAAARMGGLGRGGSTGAEHAATRYVEIMEALLRIWDEKRSLKDIAGEDSQACELQREMPVPEEPVHGHGGFGEDAGSMQMNVDLSLLGGDMFSDSAFPWDGIGSCDWGIYGL